jgi:hypothetical protein
MMPAIGAAVAAAALRIDQTQSAGRRPRSIKMSHRARRRRGGRQAIASGAGFLRPPGVRWRRSLLVQPGAGCLVTPDWGFLPAAPVDDHARSRSRKKIGE